VEDDAGCASDAGDGEMGMKRAGVAS
jgi:hypothetical protein